MTSVSAPRPSPWRTVWFSPRDTIERIVAANPRYQVLFIAAIGAIAGFFADLIVSGLSAALSDWRILIAVVVGGAILGVISLYISGLFFTWSGRLFGGRASAVEVRAFLAWGGVPNVVLFVCCLILLAALKLSPQAPSALRMSVGLLAGFMMLLSLWAMLMTLLMLARVQHFGFWRTVFSGLVGYLLSLVLILAVVLFRAFLFQPFNVPSGSVKPTLLVGDYFFVSKYSYGYSRYSLPLSLPLISGRILAAEPQRGDMVVFRLKDGQTDYVKRVVGLPGDRIQMIDGVLTINGAPVKREPMEDFVDNEDGKMERIKRWRETLPNGVSYQTLDLVERGPFDNTPVYTVPPGHCFTLGDNRDNSVDSRMLNQVGYVPLENLIGRAEFIFFSLDRDNPGEPAVRFDRIGMRVR